MSSSVLCEVVESDSSILENKLCYNFQAHHRKKIQHQMQHKLCNSSSLTVYAIVAANFHQIRVRSSSTHDYVIISNRNSLQNGHEVQSTPLEKVYESRLQINTVQEPVFCVIRCPHGLSATLLSYIQTPGFYNNTISGR